MRSVVFLPLFTSLCLLDLTISVVYYDNHVNKKAPHQFKSIYERKFADEAGRESNGFGRAVDIYGDMMLVGSCFDDNDGDQSGSAHLFKLIDTTPRGWKYVETLWVNDTSAYDYFGWDVALTHQIAAVGAWQHDSLGYEDNGAVYIFENILTTEKKMKWNMTTKLSGFNNAQYFGISLAFSKWSDVLFIGAAGSTYNYEQEVSDVGAVFVAVKSFSLDRWVILSTLHPVDGKQYDYYGISVAVDYLTGVVGAYGRTSNSGAEGAGAVYVYKCDGADDYYFDYSAWFLEARLLASDAQPNDFFGRSVAVYEDTVAVGADGTDDSGTSSGSVYIFKRDGGTSSWTQTVKLLPPANSQYDLFGGSIALWEDSLIIGADGDSQADVRMGSAWFYHRSYHYDKYTDSTVETWNQILQLTASDRSSRDLYGSDVAIYEDKILIGAEVGDGYEVNSGACYVYTLPPDNLDEILSGGSGTWSTGTVVFLSLATLALGMILCLYRKTLFGQRERDFYPGHQESATRKVRPHLSLSLPLSPLTLSGAPGDGEFG
jgi:hypothetical protein